MSKNISVEWTGDKVLMEALQRKSEADFNKVVAKNLMEMRERAVRTRVPSMGGTPVGDYVGGGQLRMSASIDVGAGIFGYTKHYAPHVEFGHRQNVGQFVPAIGKRLVKPFVPGRHFLKNNVRMQTPIFNKDLEEAMARD